MQKCAHLLLFREDFHIGDFVLRLVLRLVEMFFDVLEGDLVLFLEAGQDHEDSGFLVHLLQSLLDLGHLA